MNAVPLSRFSMLRAPRANAVSTLADDVRRGLLKAPRSIPPKYFYDDAGSALFDRICDLPEYYPTRAEHALLRANAADVVERSGATGLIEIGSGMARKTKALIAALAARGSSPVYVPFDISEDALAMSAKTLLESTPGIEVRALVGEFPRDLPMLARVLPADRRRPRLFAFLGSTIGNLDEDEAPAFVRAVADLMIEPDSFLLGVDLVKDTATLVAAYNDRQGVTARFNKNVLVHINRQLRGTFDPDAFDHEAIYDEAKARIEMRLVSRRAQRVELHAIDASFELAAGERILTEISRKLTRASAEQTLARGGMTLTHFYEGPAPAFALCLARRSR